MIRNFIVSLVLFNLCLPAGMAGDFRKPPGWSPYAELEAVSREREEAERVERRRREEERRAARARGEGCRDDGLVWSGLTLGLLGGYGTLGVLIGGGLGAGGFFNDSCSAFGCPSSDEIARRNAGEIILGFTPLAVAVGITGIALGLAGAGEDCSDVRRTAVRDGYDYEALARNLSSEDMAVLESHADEFNAHLQAIHDAPNDPLLRAAVRAYVAWLEENILDHVSEEGIALLAEPGERFLMESAPVVVPADGIDLSGGTNPLFISEEGGLGIRF